MASGRLIDYLGRGLLAARPATPDLATGGLGFYYATDNSTLYAWDGTAWQAVTSGSAGQVNTVVAGAKISVDSTDPVNPVVSAPTLQPFTVTATESGTTRTALPAAAWGYVRFTNSGTKTYTFDSAQSYVTDTEFHGRNVGAGALTIAGAGSFVVTPPAGGSLTVAQGQSFIIKITGTNTADLILQMGAGGAPPSGPTVTLVAATQILPGTTGLTSVNTTVPATAAVNDLLIAYVMRRSALTATPAGWTLAATSGVFTGSGENQYVDVYYKTAVSGDIGASTTWTQTTSNRMSVSIAAFRKSDGSAFSLVTTNTSIKTATATAYDSSFIPAPAITATANNQLLVFAASGVTMAAANTSAVNPAYAIGASGTTTYAGSTSTDVARLVCAWKSMMNGEVLNATAQFMGGTSGSGSQLGAVVALFQ